MATVEDDLETGEAFLVAGLRELVLVVRGGEALGYMGGGHLIAPRDKANSGGGRRTIPSGFLSVLFLRADRDR